MKRFLCVLGLVALSLTWGGSAFATDQDTFSRLIAKVAPTFDSLFVNFKPKLACDCLSGNQPGVLAGNTGNIFCLLPIFNPDGSLGSVGTCEGGFVVLH